MKQSRRSRQVSDVVRAELARLVRTELADPHIGFATITDVEMAPDLRSGRVFVSVLGPPEQFEKSVGALNRAAGHLRGLVGRNCGLRFAPELHFVADRSIERGARIEELLRTVTPADAAPDEPPSPGENGPGPEKAE